MSVNSFENYPMSWKPVRPQTKQPLYRALAEQLEQDINHGVLLPGTKLPPQRELADFLDINVSTIARSFKLCAKKGLLCGAVGSGTFVAYDAASNLFLIPPHEIPHLIKMGSMVPGFAPHAMISSPVKKMIAEPDFNKLFQYGSREGAYWQKKVACCLIEKAGYQTTADALLPASGGQNAITAIMAGLFHAGDRIGVDPITYPGLKTTAKMLGIHLVPIRQANGEMSEEGLLHACKNENIKGLYIMPDYQNPTTHIMSKKCRKMIASFTKAHGLIVIEDGIHSLVSKKPLSAVATYAPEQIIYIASFSKTFLPGLRLAYIVTPIQYRTTLSNALYNINLSLSPFLTELASRMIASKDAEKIIEFNRNLTKKRNQLVNQYLADYTVLGAEECPFRWLLLPDHLSGEQFEAMAYQHGVQVYASERFAVGNAKPISAVRLAISAPANMDELETGLKILVELLQKSK